MWILERAEFRSNAESLGFIEIYSKAKVDYRSDSMDDRVGGPRCFPWTGKMSGARFPRRRSFQEHETSDNAQYFIRASKMSKNLDDEKKLRVVQRKNEKQRNIKKNRRRKKSKTPTRTHILSPFSLLQLLQIYIHTHTKHMLLRQIVISHVIALFVFGKGEGLQKFIQDSRGHADIFRATCTHPASVISHLSIERRA